MIAIPSRLAGWLRFQRLDVMEHIEEAFTLAWRLTDQPDDPWTDRINGFKYRKVPDLRGAQAALDFALPDLLEAKQWHRTDIGLTVALSSEDTQINNRKFLPRCGRAVAGGVGLQWLPGLLTKQVHRPLHTLKWNERQAEVDGKYTACGLGDLEILLVLDDMITEGSTLSEIGRAVKAVNPGVEVYGAALGKCERVAYARERGHEINNERVPEEWADRWDRG